MRSHALSSSTTAAATILALAVWGCGGGSGSATATSAGHTTAAAPVSRPTSLLFRADRSAGAAVTPAEVTQTVEILGRRLADRGIAGATVARSGSERIAVELPDRRTADRVKLGLSAPGRLALYDWERNVLGADGRPHPADNDVTGGTIAGDPGAGSLTRSVATRIAAAHDGVLVRPEPQPASAGATSAARDAFFVLADRPALRGSDLVNPQQELDATTDEPTVTFDFTPAGAKRWRTVTRVIARRGAARVRPGVAPTEAAQHFAIVLDGTLLSVPYIDPQQNPDGIDPADGTQIVGGFTVATARDLAALLKSGPLPVVLHLLGERQR
jgi:SecD/SecF fusion protein